MIGGMGSAVTPDLSKGGTIDGDLTIGSNSDLVVTGDFKVEGAGSFAYDEIIEGTIGATRVNIGTRDASGNPPTDNASYMLQLEKYGGTANIKLTRTGNASSEWSNIHNEATIGTITEHPFVLQTHSTDRLTITSAGLIGINTSSPSYALDVVGVGRFKASQTTDQLILTDSTNSTNSSFRSVSGTLFIKPDGSNIKATLNSAGRLGIGTSSPSHPLHIKTATTSSYLRLETNDGDTGYVGYTQDEGIKLATASGSSGVKVFIKDGSNDDVLTVDASTGRLGIGATSPSHLLSLTASNTVSLIKFLNSSATSNGGEVGLNGIDAYLWNRESLGKIYFGTNNTTRMMITYDGKIGINSSSPQSKLHVIGGDGTTSRFEESVSGKYSDVDGNSFVASHELYLKAGAVSNQHIYFQNGSSTNGVINSSGNWGVGTSSPDSDYRLTVQQPTGTNKDYILGIQDNGSNTAFKINTDSGDNVALRLFNGSGAQKIAFDAGGVSYVNNGQNFGIGTDNPSDNVEISDTDPRLRIVSERHNTATSSTAHYSFLGYDSSGERPFIISNQSNTPIIFRQSAGDERMRIHTGGNIGIGINNPGEKLSISSGNISLDAGYFVKFGTNNSRISTGGSNLVLQTGAVSRLILDDNSRISLSNNDGGDNSNTVFGALSGTSLASGGIYNVLVGANTGASISTGDNNVALGTSSLRYGTGSNNIAIGYLAHYGSGSGASNVSIGSESARSLTTGSENVSIGRGSSYSATVSSENISIGTQSLYTNTAGKRNIAIGLYSQNAGNLTVEGQIANNVSIGYASSYHNVTGTANTAVGNEAMKGASGNSHSNNTAVGYFALNGVSTGGDNVALGANSLDALTSGIRNTALGYNSATALGAGETGNIAIGWNSMSTMDEGSGGTINYNIALGVQAYQS